MMMMAMMMMMMMMAMAVAMMVMMMMMMKRLFRRVKILRVYIAELTEEMLNSLQPRGHKTETTNWTSYL